MRIKLAFEICLFGVFVLAATALPVFARPGTYEAVYISAGSIIGLLLAAALALRVRQYAQMKENAKLKTQFTGLQVFFLLFALSQLLKALYYVDLVPYALFQVTDLLVLLGAILALAMLWKRE